MKKSLLFVGILFIALQASSSLAGTVYSGVQNISLTATTLNELVRTKIDLAGDTAGTWDDFDFGIYYTYNHVLGSIFRNSPSGSPVGLAHDTQFAWIENYAPGDEMTGAFAFGSPFFFNCSTVNGEEGYFVNKSGYAGLRLGDFDGPEYFGWMQISVENVVLNSLDLVADCSSKRAGKTI